RRKGQTALASYRDPNIKKTLTIYNNLPKYLKNLKLSEEELTKYIIGTISPLEQPKSARSKGRAALSRLKNNWSRKDIIQLKEDILKTKAEDFPKIAPKFEELLDEKTKVVIGNKAQVEKEKDLFDQIYTLY
ncbi:MAG: peptidase M16, partial [Atopostipes sp.]|nr:peptidase M16 [Atopostipes sp.]